MKDIDILYLYRKKLVKPYIDKILSLIGSISMFMSFVLITTIVFEYGFVLQPEERVIVGRVYDFTWILFLVNSLSNIIFNFKTTVRQFGKLAWIVTIMLYLTLFPLFWHDTISPTTAWILQLLKSHIYHTVILAVLSLLQISSGIVRLLGKRLNPSSIFTISFLVIILIGAGLLMLPKSTYNGILFIDALFTSTSATCVTGLSTVDVATVFTPLGLLFIMILIQIGGLGVMTLTSFFAVFYMGNTSFYNQSMMCDMVSSKSLNSLFSTLLYILGFTLIIEGAGAILIFWNIHDTLGMTLNEEIAFSIFHSISAFCNAGFSTLPDNLGNEMLMQGHNIFYLTISMLVVLGGIGFPVLVNLFDKLRYTLKRTWKKITLHTTKVEHRANVFDLNTKIAIGMTLALIVFGMVVIAVLEWNRSLAEFSTVDKIVQSVFNSITPRTAGFNSVSMSSFSFQTILIMLMLMVIGGGAQSTAGGVKVNAFAVILLNIRAMILGRDRVAVFNRVLSVESVRRSNSTLMLYMILIFMSIFLLTYFEPYLPFRALLFEAISALSTVGASLDITPQLGNDSKIVVIVLMFVGRVGLITVMASIIRHKKINHYRYPSGDVIIN
ncbi:MAG: potassium transporter TrkG [Rikenellaceae bacterium]